MASAATTWAASMLPPWWATGATEITTAGLSATAATWWWVWSTAVMAPADWAKSVCSSACDSTTLRATHQRESVRPARSMHSGAARHVDSATIIREGQVPSTAACEPAASVVATTAATQPRARRRARRDTEHLRGRHSGWNSHYAPPGA